MARHDRTPRSLLLLLIAVLAPAAPAAPCQEGRPAAAARRPPPTAPLPPDPAEIRARWAQMTPEERRVVQESFERWQKLSPEERDMVRRRHERLDQERRRAGALLPDADQARLKALDPEARRRELTLRATAMVRERFEQLPPELRQRVQRELEGTPPLERERRVKQIMAQEAERQIQMHLKAMAERGVLSPDDIESYRRRAKESPKVTRFDLLRDFMLEHPHAFRLPPDAAQHLRDVRDPALVLHLLNRLRPRPPRPHKEGPRPNGG